MNKIILILSALALMLAVSCQKASPEPKKAEANNTLKLNLTVAGLGGESADPSTRAAKTSWVAGDKLNLFFDDWTAETQFNTPDLILTYNGTSWEAGTFADGRGLQESGKFSAVYEGFNDLSRYSMTYDMSNTRAWFYGQKGDRSYCGDTTPYSVPLTAYSNNKSYTYNYETKELTATIHGWTFLSRFKVLIKNDNGFLTGSASDYYLQVKTSASAYPRSFNAIVVEPDNLNKYPSISFSNGNTIGWTAGVAEEDGVAFYYYIFNVTKQDVIFTLTQKGVDAVGKTYTATNKTFASDASMCKGVAINYSKFASAE